MEKVAEFPTELRATQGRLAWAIKDRIVESLSTRTPLTKRAPRFRVVLLASLGTKLRLRGRGGDPARMPGTGPIHEFVGPEEAK